MFQIFKVNLSKRQDNESLTQNVVVRGFVRQKKVNQEVEVITNKGNIFSQGLPEDCDAITVRSSEP